MNTEETKTPATNEGEAQAATEEKEPVINPAEVKKPSVGRIVNYYPAITDIARAGGRESVPAIITNLRKRGNLKEGEPDHDLLIDLVIFLNSPEHPATAVKLSINHKAEHTKEHGYWDWPEIVSKQVNHEFDPVFIEKAMDNLRDMLKSFDENATENQKGINAALAEFDKRIKAIENANTAIGQAQSAQK